MIENQQIVTCVTEVFEVSALPRGAVVGDKCGGRSFNDNIAAALERRSFSGWQEFKDGAQSWTLIFIER